MRSRATVLTELLSLTLLAGCSVPEEASQPIDGPPTQIAWQRTLDDAKRLAEATGRPLFVAINMDGESASERIVRENYRDPEFVDRTRDCICVVGSLFRHNPRDVDDAGRRLPCPRLGSVTCGEHIALEPQLFDLLGGERVAPRHAFVRAPGGEPVFDESLLFDIRDLDRMLVDALDGTDATAAHRRGGGGSFDAVSSTPFAAARAGLEQRIATASDAEALERQLDAMGRTADPGWRHALAVAVRRSPRFGPEASSALDERLVEVARDLGAADALAKTLRDRLTSIESVPIDGRLTLWRPEDARLLALLVALDPDGAQTRSWVTGHRVLGNVPASGSEPGARDASVPAGDVFELETILNLADHVALRESGALPRPSPLADALPSVDELIGRLDELEAKSSAAAGAGDPESYGAMAEATLALARQRMASGASDVPLLLEDAARQFELALAARPDRTGWWLGAARTAYLQSDFARESAFGTRALATVLGDSAVPNEASLAPDAAVLQNGLAVEALRWIGDAEARLAAANGDEPAAVRARGLRTALRALGLVAASPYGTPQDWIGFVSLLESFGLVRASLEANLCAAARFPADADVRQSLRGILWSVGRAELEPAAARRIAHRHPEDGVAAWFVGYAYLLAAEDARRAERFDLAIAAYDDAERAFRDALERDGSLAASCSHYVGVSWLGRGMAHLLAVRQPAAADALAAAARSGASIRAAVDGLQRDVFDLVDQSLEWRAGRPSPVDAIALLDRLEAADPGTAFWAGAIADTMLREGLRADGKNPNRVERETVGAAGETIIMPMGLPTALGDSYLAFAVTAGRRATRHDDADPKPLAQALTITAERELERIANGETDVETRLDLARECLREAAPLYGVPVPGESADRDELVATAAALRDLLGPARPRFRAGR